MLLMLVTLLLPTHEKYFNFLSAFVSTEFPHATFVPFGMLQEISTMFQSQKFVGYVFLLCVDGSQVRISVPDTLTMTCFIPSDVRFP